MDINRAWAMPSKDTFSIQPITALVEKYIMKGGLIIDPFAGDSKYKELCVTNDLDKDKEADYHMDSLDFLEYCK